MPEYISGSASDAANNGDNLRTLSSGSRRFGSNALIFGVLKQSIIASVKCDLTRFSSTFAVSSCSLEKPQSMNILSRRKIKRLPDENGIHGSDLPILV